MAPARPARASPEGEPRREEESEEKVELRRVDQRAVQAGAVFVLEDRLEGPRGQRRRAQREEDPGRAESLRPERDRHDERGGEERRELGARGAAADARGERAL